MIEHILKVSLERSWIVSIIYMSDKGISERDIRVLGMEGGSIRAYCYLKGEIRNFKASNILSASWRNRNKKEVPCNAACSGYAGHRIEEAVLNNFERFIN